MGYLIFIEDPIGKEVESVSYPGYFQLRKRSIQQLQDLIVDNDFMQMFFVPLCSNLFKINSHHVNDVFG
jgi:hypothetical protein